MSVVDANVAIMNGLYNNWSISSPPQDLLGDANGQNKLNTLNPAKIHFTTRRFAYAPHRTHSFQISVRRMPWRYQHLQLGSIPKYLKRFPVLIDVWVLTTTTTSVETAETYFANMIAEIERITRVFSTQMGSNIQSVLLDRGIPDEKAMEEEPPKLHAQIPATALLFLMSTS